MKKLLMLLILLITITAFAQDKYYTKGLANGYAWQQESVSSPVYSKEESLLASLQRRTYLKNIDSTLNEKSFPLGCEDFIDSLMAQDISKTIEVKTIVKMIDDFYSIKENLIIPVLGAYCYSLKKFTGKSEIYLEGYKIKLLNYSETK